MSFSQQGPRTVCILSANGAISNVTLRQPATSGGLVTYEVVVASFIAEGKKSKPAEPRKVEPMSAPPQMATYVPAPVASPPSEGTSSASSDDSGSPINHGGMPYNHSGGQQHQQQQHMPPAYASGGWSLSAHHQNNNRHDADMKMMSN
ncbi:hypothetical protein ACQJBY_001925 [Aegilops geniculata]